MSENKNKSGKKPDGSVLDSVEELPIVRKIRSGIDDLEKLIVGRAPGPDLLGNVIKLKKLLSRLELGILKNHLKGSFSRDLSQKDSSVANEAIEEIIEYLDQKE